MRYQSKSSIAYMFRNFLRLVYVTLPVALLLAFAAFMYKPTVEVNLFLTLVNNGFTMDNYSDSLLQSLSLLRFGRYWWVFAIAVVVLPLSLSLMTVKIDRHMRTGQMPALPVKRAFGIYPLMLAYTLSCILLSELGALVPVGISYLIEFFGNAEAIVAVVLVLSFAMRVLTTFVFALLIVTFPLKYGENYRFNRAMSYSARVMFRNKKSLWCIAFAYPLCRIVTLTLAYLLQSYRLDALVYAVAFLFAVTYVPCAAYKLYYDDVGGERRDVGRIMFG